MDVQVTTSAAERAGLFLKEFWPSMVCAIVIVGAYYYYETEYKYWAKRGIRGEHPRLIIGDIINTFTKNQLQLERDRVVKYGKVYGTYRLGMPRLVVADAEIIRQICIKDFNLFQNHSQSVLSNKFQKKFLVWLTGNDWKRIRTIMSPSFTSGKIKKMAKFLDACAEDLIENFREQIKKCRPGDKALINLQKTYSMFTLDGIATCCYGLKLHRESGRTKSPDGAHKLSRDDFMQVVSKLLRFNPYKILIVLMVPKFILKMLNFTLVPESAYGALGRRIEKLIEIRRRSAGTRKYDDLLQLLVDAKLGDQMELSDADQKENHHAGLTHESLVDDQKKMIEDVRNELKNGTGDGSEQLSNKHSMSDFEILCEAILVMSAGLETTSILLTNASYCLAFNPGAQEKLYDELKKIVSLNEDKTQYYFDYETLTSCQYLDAVISETLRFLVPAPVTDRVALEDYHIEKYDVTIPKGSAILLGLYAVAHDPDYWSEPEKFDPERFMPGNKEKIVPGSYAPFSMGPRHCIGMRFSLTEAKIGLAKVVMKYRFEKKPDAVYPPVPMLTSGLVVIKDPFAIVVPRD